MTPIQTAIFDLIHEHPDGVAGAGRRLGKAEGTMRHEARPPEGSSSKAGVLDMNKLMHSSGNLRLLQALCHDHAGMFVPLPVFDEANHATDVRSAMARIGALASEFGDVMQESSKALADGQVSDNDLARVSREWSDLVACGTRLMQQLTQLNAQLHDDRRQDHADAN